MPSAALHALIQAGLLRAPLRSGALHCALRAHPYHPSRKRTIFGILTLYPTFTRNNPLMEKQPLPKLIQMAIEKDQKSQTRLINYYWMDVFSFVLKKVHDENSADELTVSVFSKVLAKLDLYDSDFQFKTWILTIAQNTIIDYWRRKSRENENPDENLGEVRNQFARSPEELMISEEDQQKIQNIVESMDSNYREIIRLRFFEEKSIREIAEELHLSVANTKVRIMRAKKVLSELLRGHDFDLE